MAEKEMDLREDLQNKLRKTSEWVQRLKKMLIEGKVDPSPERILAKKIEEMTCNKIIQLMEQKDTRVLIIERKYLLELFNRQIIEIIVGIKFLLPAILIQVLLEITLLI